MRVHLALAGIASILACGTYGAASPAMASRTATACEIAQTDSILAYYRHLGDSGTTHPRMLHPGAQVYPAEMQATGTPGWARLEFLVRTDGTADPCAIRALEASDKAFEAAGVSMILNSRFSKPSRPTYMEHIVRWQVT